MRFLLVLLVLVSDIFADDFINKFEYGEMLYKNPRGVSCEGCHGALGEGKQMGKVIKNKKEVTIIAPNIKTASTDLVKKSMSSRKSIMPQYFLTDSEIDAIVFYVKKLNERSLAEANSTKSN